VYLTKNNVRIIYMPCSCHRRRFMIHKHVRRFSTHEEVLTVPNR